MDNTFEKKEKYIKLLFLTHYYTLREKFEIVLFEKKI